MITTCLKCGGLKADPGEKYAGKGCECPQDHSAEVQAVFNEFMFSFREQEHFPLEHDIKNLANKLLAASGVKERVK